MSALTSTLGPSFAGALRGEALKLSRQLSLWLSLGGALLLFAVIVLAITGNQHIKDQLTNDPTGWAYDELEAFRTAFQIGAGLFLLSLDRV